MNQKLRSLLCALPALAGFADAQIDSGGGKAAVGSLTNHGSIGGIVATAPAPLGSLTLRNGLIEILYATAPLDPDADADGNGLPDAWEDEHFPGPNVVDPAAAPDGDGTTTRMEYIAGTDPRDRASVFRSTGSLFGSVSTLPIRTVESRKYEMWAAKDLASWHVRETLIDVETSQNPTFGKSGSKSATIN